MTQNELVPYLLDAVLASREAGEAIMEIYGSAFSVEFKDDRSPLTLADKRSNEVIFRRMNDRQGMSGAGPEGTAFPMLSEEGRTIPYEERMNWEYFWVVDPLDGTKEFIKRNGEFTVNIALMHEHAPVLGVIYVPVKETIYYGMQGLGAYRLDDAAAFGWGDLGSDDVHRALELLLGSSLHLGGNARPSEDEGMSKLVVAGSRSHSSSEFEDFLKEMKQTYGEVEFISAGSSLKFCLVAEGKADIYPRFGPTMEWDTAAGQCIVESAGGRVLSMDDGRPLQYNKRDLKNPFFVCEGKRSGLFKINDRR